MAKDNEILKAEQNVIIYHTEDGKVCVSLMAQDGNVWMNQKQLAELFDTSLPNVNMHISNILKDRELDDKSVIKEYLITALRIFCAVQVRFLQNRWKS